MATMAVFLKKLWPKPQNVLTMVILIFIGVSNCLEGNIYLLPKNVVLPKMQVFTLKQQFLLKLKITCYSLSLFILIKLRTIY